VPLSRLRLRLSAWFALAFVAGLTALSLTLYAYLRHQSSLRLTRSLRTSAVELADAIRFELREAPSAGLAHAVSDLDAAPADASEPPAAYEVTTEPPSTPPRRPAPAEPDDAPPPRTEVPAAAEAALSESPRRRSTVREPVANALHHDESFPAPSFASPAPAVEPVVSSSTENESSDRPRRSGWWSRRVLGKG
jgi:ribonuclease E